MSPYRVPPHASERDRCRTTPFSILAVFGLFWLSSALRVAMGLARGEVFGAEASVAFIVTVSLPLALLRAR